MSRDRGVNAVDIPAKERHDAGPLLLPRALPAPRSLYFVGGLLLVAAIGLIVAFAVAPDTSAPATAPIPAAQAAPTACERSRADADTLARDITRVIHVGRVKVRTFNVLVRRYRADAADCEAAS